MKTGCLWAILALTALILVGNIVMLFFFTATTVGLSPAEIDMLLMTSSQINAEYSQANSLVNALQGVQNVTANLTELAAQYEILSSVHEGNVDTTEVLSNRSLTQEQELLSFNATIESRFEIVVIKIDNTTIPASLNLTLFDNTTEIFNGTVLMANPNAPLFEYVNLTYVVKEQLNSTFIEIGPQGASFDYNTPGLLNYVSLVGWSPPLFSDTANSFAGFTRGQVLDAQRDKVMANPPIASREYVADSPGIQEIRLVFDGLFAGAQTIALNEKLQINVGFI